MASGDDDLLRFEHRLRRSAERSGWAVSDDQLDAILRRVEDRRARRVAGLSVLQAPAGVNQTSDTGSEPSRAGSVEPAPAADVGPGGPPGTVIETVEVTSDVRILRVGRPAGFGFEAGQHTKLGASGGKTNSYSIASAPHENHLEFCVELVPGGRVTRALFALGPGDGVSLGSGGKGNFVLDETSNVHLMVATVTGIAPLRSMLRYARHRGIGGRMIVAHGASHADELAYREELSALAASGEITYEPTVSRPDSPRNDGWTGRTGRVDPLAAELARDLDPGSTRVYAAGNPGMVENVSRELGARGFEVSTEAFD